MLRNISDDLYIGVTKDVQQRLQYHNETRGASFTKSRSEFKIVFLEQYDSLSSARTREIQIKKWRREKKELLITRYTKNLPTKQSLPQKIDTFAHS